MRSFFARMILRSQINTANRKTQKKFLPWDQIQKIALILDKDEQLNKSAIDKFIEDSKKHIEVYYIELGSKQPTYSDWHCFSKKDRSFLHLPGKQAEAELKKQNFDAVINTCAESNLFAFSVFSSLSTCLRCGRNNGFNLADLIIQRTETVPLKNYLDETVKYLKMIRI